eukprot:scaffold6596_cov161-Amphora_coffeaeformis.AAC.11
MAIITGIVDCYHTPYSLFKKTPNFGRTVEHPFLIYSPKQTEALKFNETSSTAAYITSGKRTRRCKQSDGFR